MARAGQITRALPTQCLLKTPQAGKRGGTHRRSEMQNEPGRLPSAPPVALQSPARWPTHSTRGVRPPLGPLLATTTATAPNTTNTWPPDRHVLSPSPPSQQPPHNLSFMQTHNQPSPALNHVSSTTCARPRKHSCTQTFSATRHYARHAVQRNIVQHSTTQHNTAQQSTAQHSTAQHSTAQHSTT